MSKSRVLVCLLLAAVVFSGISFAVTPDRVSGDLASGPKLPLRGNVHGLARPEFDLGRADGNRPMHRVSIAFHPSAAQQQDLDRFIAELGDRNSPNYHKYLTPAQFADRFGMSRNDVSKVVQWLQSEGFTNISVNKSRNEISFDGTVGQVESVFSIEMHNFLVDGVVHTANAMNPSVPAALAGAMIGMSHLNDFAPKARAKVHPHLTSYVSGNHYLTPGDFATIYDIGPLYSAGSNGSGQSIAVIGQSTVSTTDLNNFRSAAGLPASTVTMTLVEGTATRCPNDEGESDLDLEWSGGIAKNAKIIFVYAGLDTSAGDSCGGNRNFNVWDALKYAADNNVAPFISTSYGFCEAGLGQTEVNIIQGYVTTALTHGQTIVAASGDAGAADCDSAPSATQGLAVDVPAAIPGVTGAGGNEFTLDTTLGADPPYWAAAGTSTDTISSALQPIPEEAWNDTSQSNTGTQPSFSASGGGASIFFAKPSWQTGIGVPADGKRDVPDISLSASQFHDPYLVCSEDDGKGGTISTCTAGFRTGTGGTFSAVGGTSVAAPSFAAILALVNEYVGNSGTTGLAPVNPTLYSLAASTPAAFHDVTSGDNKVPCTTGTGCTGGSVGFTAGTGYDQVTGLGSVDVFVMAQALVPFSVSAGAFTPSSVAAGTTTTTTITITPNNGFTGTVSFACSGLPLGATCTFNPTTVANGSGSTQLTIQTAGNTAAGATQVTVKGTSGTTSASTTVSLAVTATTEGFSLVASPAVSTLSVAQGQISSAVNLTVTNTGTPLFVNTNGSSSSTVLPVSYTCTGLPSESVCNFSPATSTSSPTVSFTVTTTPPTARLQRPLDRAGRIFYAVLLPGLFGIVFTLSSRKRSLSGVRMLGVIAVVAFSTLWMASCGGTSNSSSKDPGTPTGTYNVVVNATTGGSAPINSSFSFKLTVTP